MRSYLVRRRRLSLVTLTVILFSVLLLVRQESTASATAGLPSHTEAIRQAGSTPTTIDSSSNQITFSGWWPTTSDSTAIGSSERIGEFGGDAAALAFTGSSITVVYRQNTNRGQAQVRIDDVVVGMLDQYGPSQAQRTATYTVTPGTHTIRIVISRTRQSASAGFFVGVDAFQVGGGTASTPIATNTLVPTSTMTSPPAATSTRTPTNTPVNTNTPAPTATNTAVPTATSTPGAGVTVDSTSAQVTYNGWWPTTFDSQAIGGSERIGEFGGTFASLPFTGSSITLVYRQDTNRGQALLRIDGNVVGTLDQYGPSQAQRTVTYNVAPGAHTIQVTINRTRQAASTGFFVGVDAFIVGNAPAPTPTNTPVSTLTHTPVPTSTGTAPPTPTATPTPLPLSGRRVNIPQFGGAFVPGEASVFWYGRVTPSENYTDVRIGYTASSLWVQANIADMHLRYDASGQVSRLDEYDSVGLTVTTSAGVYRFQSGLSWFEGRANYQRSEPAVPFTTTSGWRGNAPNGTYNSQVDDRGWVTTFEIPFSSLGGGAPTSGTVWPLTVTTYDRDDAAGGERSQASWSGEVRFGLPGYTAPTTAQGTVVIRQGNAGVAVPDAAVGGGTDCGGAADPVYFDTWGSFTYAGQPSMNIQNQADIADWPCFSKYYVTFPLGTVPSGKRIVSARLILHQFGGSGGGSQTAYPSLIQVSTTDPGWTEGSISWNSAPQARENVARTTVGVFHGPLVWPGTPHTWDVSRPVAAAYAAGSPLALVLYSADEPYHSGKYFTTSNSGDWNAVGRPTLEVVWGD